MGKQVVDTFGCCSGYACSGKNRRGKRFAGTDKTLRVNGFIISSSPQMGPVLADKQRAVRVLLKITDNQRVIVEILNLLFTQWSIRVSRVSGLEVHVSDKLPELHSVSIVLLSVGIILLGEALLDDSARLKQTVRDNTRITLGAVLVLHSERHE